MAERCGWCGTEPIYVDYHDREWGRPETDSRALFEKLTLDGFQAGLSWITILKKRDAFRTRFEGFDPARIARWGDAEITAALADPGIVRHRGKIEATIGNARAWLEIEADQGFDRFLWSFVDFKPVLNHRETMAQIPAETEMSKEMSKALRAAGFRFCGPTIVYAFAQAVGMVNDHLTGCPQHAECAAEASRIRF